MIVSPDPPNCSVEPDACRSVAIVASATFTMLTSSSAMNWPVSSTMSSVQGPFWSTRTLVGCGSRRDAVMPRACGCVVHRAEILVVLVVPVPPCKPWGLSVPAGTMVDLPVTAARSNKQERRSELGEFLKARRAQVRPADVGLPAGDRRRTPGLRREEVALLAGVGITWYTWLEQGRPINASAQVLDSVARTLHLGRPEREHLYRLAAATPLRPERTAD